MNYGSPLLENAVKAFTQLPGIGQKTALRLVLHLLKQDAGQTDAFTHALAELRSQIKFCRQCHYLATEELCSICQNNQRQQQTVCVVETIREVLAIEATQQYNGAYHVLGGVISPLDGIGPDKLHIDTLVARVKTGVVDELVFALNANIQGDTTIYYIQKQLEGQAVTMTTISRGIAFGGELEYADEMTLARSIQNRLPVDRLIKL